MYTVTKGNTEYKLRFAYFTHFAAMSDKPARNKQIRHDIREQIIKALNDDTFGTEKPSEQEIASLRRKGVGLWRSVVAFVTKQAVGVDEEPVVMEITDPGILSTVLADDPWGIAVCEPADVYNRSEGRRHAIASLITNMSRNIIVYKADGHDITELAADRQALVELFLQYTAKHPRKKAA